MAERSASSDIYVSQKVKRAERAKKVAAEGATVNAAGGLGTFAVTDGQRFQRFLIIGSEDRKSVV